MHLISPSWADRWNLTPAQWASIRTQYATLLYPHGVPLTQPVDVQEPGWDGQALPTGCASITRYTITAPGQRPGGSPQYTYLMYPTANPRNELVVWMCGHSGVISYLVPDEGSTIPSLLAAGYHVLACDMPGFEWVFGPVGSDVVIGGTWTYADGAWANVGGTSTHIHTDPTAHAFNFLGDDGPLAYLLFVHHVLLSTTSAIAELLPTRALLAGHSGGSVCGSIVGALDSRFETLCWNCGGLPYNQYYSAGNYADWETYLLTEPFISQPITFDLWGPLRLAMSWPGRRTDVVSALNDEYWTIRDAGQWQSDVTVMSEQVARLGNTLTSWLDPASYPQHNMHAARVTRMLGILAEP